MASPKGWANGKFAGIKCLIVQQWVTMRRSESAPPQNPTRSHYLLSFRTESLALSGAEWVEKSLTISDHGARLRFLGLQWEMSPLRSTWQSYARGRRAEPPSALAACQSLAIEIQPSHKATARQAIAAIFDISDTMPSCGRQLWRGAIVCDDVGKCRRVSIFHESANSSADRRNLRPGFATIFARRT